MVSGIAYLSRFIHHRYVQEILESHVQEDIHWCYGAALRQDDHQSVADASGSKKVWAGRFHEADWSEVDRV